MRRMLVALLVLGFALGARAGDPASQPVVEKGPFCSPLFAAGVVLGISDESDVAALLGRGVSIAPEAKDRARAHLDPTGTVALVTEIGADALVARLTLRWASSLPPGLRKRLARRTSDRMRHVNSVGPAGGLRLGQAPAVVRERFGAPQRVEGARWIYLTDYAPTECVASETVIVTFESGAVARIDFDGED